MNTPTRAFTVTLGATAIVLSAAACGGHHSSMTPAEQAAKQRAVAAAEQCGRTELGNPQLNLTSAAGRHAARDAVEACFFKADPQAQGAADQYLPVSMRVALGIA